MIGSSLGPYQVAAELGAGGMGRVYLATVMGRAPGLEVGTRVALKIVHPHLLETAGAFKRFLREAEIGRSVRHENVVRTYDVDAIRHEGNDIHFLVMEYVEGQTLRELLLELGRVPEELCRHIGREASKGLAAIHAAGAVHRDVKPENVLITKEHAVKVMDLGVARLADEQMRLSQTGAFVGSVEYAAPEQYGSEAGIDGRADLHALGVTLYELSTGVSPYRGDSVQATLGRVLNEVPRRCAELNPQLSAFFEEVVHALLGKKREDRLASAAALVEVLDEGEGSEWWKARAKAIRALTKKPLRRMRIPRETALCGRDAEVSRLRAHYERAKAGEGQVVLIEGEAGIGKSRLVDEVVGFLQRAGEDLNFLYGSYPPGGAATVAGAFSTAYREQFGSEGLSDTLEGYLAETPALVPAFAALLRGESTPPGVEPLTKDSLQTVFVRATRGLAAERVTIALIDDLHFAPEEGRSLFAALAMAVPGHRILLVGTARPGLDEAWLLGLDRIGAARVSLPRLGAKDLVRLLADTLRSERLAEELAGRIATKSDGNPYFVFEILRGMREGKLLTKREDGTWAGSGAGVEIQVPPSVLDLVRARVADLDEADKTLLDAAACCGFEFDPWLAAQAVGLAKVPALQRLARIERKHRLVRSAGRRFVFDHHQVQEALESGLPEMLREEYHAAIADALEAQHDAAARDPQALDGALCVELAEHLFQGGRGGRALRYLDAALTHLEKGYSNDAAIGLAGRALAAPGLVAGRDRAELLLRVAGRLDVLGRRDAQRKALSEALALADQDGEPGLRARVKRLFGVLLAQSSSGEEAEKVLLEAVALARAAGAKKAESLATGNLGSVYLSRGRDGEAREHYERQLALARAMGDRGGEGVALTNLGIVLELQGAGNLAEAERCFERSLAIARQSGNRHVEAIALGNLGNVLLGMGRLAEARECFDRSLALGREMGDRRVEAYATGMLGSFFSRVGRLAEAREHSEQNVALAREIGDRQGEAFASGDLGSVCRRLGRFAEARQDLERYLALAREVLGPRDESQALQLLADLSAEEGEASAAERLYGEALAARREIGQRSGEAETLCSRGLLFARLGRTEEARGDLGLALEIAREQSLPGVRVVAAAALPKLSRDAAAGAVATALAELLASEPLATAQQALEARFLLWQATRDPAHLAEAKRRLLDLVAHAPPDCRETMVDCVRLHREIATASEMQS